MKLLTDVGDGIAGLELQFLEGFFVVLIAVELDYGNVILAAHFDEHFLPKPEMFQEMIKINY